VRRNERLTLPEGRCGGGSGGGSSGGGGGGGDVWVNGGWDGSGRVEIVV
jgi:hypothetical protein